MTGTDTTLTQALQAALPPELHASIPSFVALLGALTAGEHTGGREPLPTQSAAALIAHLAGKRLAAGQTVVSFGEQSQLGDVTIHDVAGNNVIKHNLFVLIAPPQPARPSPADTGAAPASGPPPAQIDRVQLRQLLGAAFSASEIADLCFDLGIDHEELPSREKSALVRELIRYCERRNRIEDLLAQCRRLRPHLAGYL